MATIVVDFENCFIFILLCLFPLLCLFAFFFKKPKDLGAGCDLPPSPPSLPIVGHLHLLLSSLTHKSFKKISSKYGPLLHLRIFNVPIVLVSSASVAYEIFKTHDVNVSSRGHPPIDECLFFGSSGFVLAPYGDYWKFMKKLIVTKLFGPQALERLRGARADELERFHASLFNKVMKGEIVEIAKEAIKLTNNSICKMIMGRSCSEENGEAERVRGLVTDSFALLKKLFLTQMLEKLRISPFKKEIMGFSGKFDELLERVLVEHEEKSDHHEGADMMDVLLAAYRDKNAEYKITRNHIKSLLVIFGDIPNISLHHSPFKKEIMGFSGKFDELLERVLVEHEEKSDHHEGADMMDVLLAAYRDKNAEYKITRNHIKSLLVELILAGTDTSAQTIYWIMAEMVDKPNILERLREEIDSVVGKTKLIQETDLLDLPYLQAVIKEGLRLHPPAPIFARKVLERCKIGRYYVPKNTTLIVNSYAVMRDPYFWEDPEEFKPERFLLSSRGQEEEREKALKYLTFGTGRRGCPGVNLASIFVGTAIGTMVQCFDWKIKGDKVNMEETVAGMTLNMAHPLRCTPVARPTL